jgi:hypothetical protein
MVTLSAPTTLPLVGDVTVMLTGPLLLALFVVVGLAPPEPQPATTNAQPMAAATIAALSPRDPDMRGEATSWRDRRVSDRSLSSPRSSEDPRVAPTLP